MKARVPFKMTVSERKAMNKEIYKQIVENDRNYSLDLDYVILLTLHEGFGFGRERLKRLWNAFVKKHKELQEYYQMLPEDDGWICRRLLKEIDVEQWYKNEGL